MKKIWQLDPNSGGVKVPEKIKEDITQRITKIAEENFKGKYLKLQIKFKNQFCYIDFFEDYTEKNVPTTFSESLYGMSKEEYVEKRRNTPIHLCRLRYFGTEEWGYAFYTYSHEKYELSTFRNGSFYGKPEEAFMASSMYFH
jgi:hypothetical protein